MPLLERTHDLALNLISRIEITIKSTKAEQGAKEVIWNAFWKTFYEKFNPLAISLIERLEKEEIDNLSSAISTRDILHFSRILSYICSGTLISSILPLHDSLPVCVDDLKVLIESDSKKVDNDMVGLLEKFLEMLKDSVLPKQSFIILQEVNGKKFLIGAHIESGELQNVGIAKLSESCHKYVFDVLYTPPKEGETYILEITDRYERYHPEALTDGHLYPDDLFLLKCATPNWGAYDLTESKIGRELQAYLEE